MSTKQLTISDLVSIFIRSNFLLGSFNFELSEYDNSAGEHVVTTLQSILDSLMPSIVPLLMTFACMYLLKKGMNPLLIIVGLFAIGIVGYAVGLFA